MYLKAFDPPRILSKATAMVSAGPITASPLLAALAVSMAPVDALASPMTKTNKAEESVLQSLPPAHLPADFGSVSEIEETGVSGPQGSLPSNIQMPRETA